MVASQKLMIICVAGLLSLGGLLMTITPSNANEMTVYKSPYCGCCQAWVEHMRENGFTVNVIERENMTPVKQKLNVPERLESCHTAVIDGYVIEGHVPAQDVKKLLAEKPKARGLSVPGMPIGSPGMEQGDHKDPYTVVIFGDEGMGAFNRYR